MIGACYCPSVECFRCEIEAVNECPRCGAVYCDAHGETLCARCQDPSLALPSYMVYRGSLVALLVGSLFAVWLLILPSAGADQVGPPSSLAGIVPAPGQSVASSPTTTPAASVSDPSTPSAGSEPTAEPTPEPTAEATPEATPEPDADPIRHVVTEGDSLFAIAAQYATQGSDVFEYQNQIQAFNNISDPRTIVIGQVILVPPQ